MNQSNFWDERYSGEEYAYGTLPNEFLREQYYRLPPAAEVLCLAEGEGRNSTFLAALGFSVTGVDASRVGKSKAEQLARERGVQIKTVVADLAEYDPGIDRWDAIVSIFAHLPPAIRFNLRPRLRRALRVGGLLILEHYHPNQLQYKTGGPQDPSLLTNLEELERDFAGWEFLHRFEGERMVVEGTFHHGLAYVTQCVVRKVGD